MRSLFPCKIPFGMPITKQIRGRFICARCHCRMSPLSVLCEDQRSGPKSSILCEKCRSLAHAVDRRQAAVDLEKALQKNLWDSLVRKSKRKREKRDLADLAKQGPVTFMGVDPAKATPQDTFTIIGKKPDGTFQVIGTGLDLTDLGSVVEPSAVPKLSKPLTPWEKFQKMIRDQDGRRDHPGV